MIELPPASGKLPNVVVIIGEVVSAAGGVVEAVVDVISCGGAVQANDRICDIQPAMV